MSRRDAVSCLRVISIEHLFKICYTILLFWKCQRRITPFHIFLKKFVKNVVAVRKKRRQQADKLKRVHERCENVSAMLPEDTEAAHGFAKRAEPGSSLYIASRGRKSN